MAAKSIVRPANSPATVQFAAAGESSDHPSDVAPAWVRDPAAAQAANDAFKPVGRPSPTAADVQAKYGRQPDLAALRAKADGLVAPTLDKKIGQTNGAPLVGYVWGDVANYESGQEQFDRDAIIVRLIRRIGTGSSRSFFVVDVDMGTLAVSPRSASVTDGGKRPDSFFFDPPNLSGHPDRTGPAA